MKILAQVTQQPPPETNIPRVTPYTWLDIGILGSVFLALSWAMIRWLPAHFDKRTDRAWEERNAIRASDRDRDAEDRKLLNTILAKQLNSSETVMEDLATTLVSIARVLDLQDNSFRVIAAGFKATSQNQTKQIELLGEICDALKNKE
jgi:hypothetical protein